MHALASSITFMLHFLMNEPDNYNQYELPTIFLECDVCLISRKFARLGTNGKS